MKAKISALSLLLLVCLAALLSGCEQPAVVQSAEPQPSEESAPPLSEEEKEAIAPIVFPAPAEMLEGDCEEFAPLEDDGSREVAIQYVDFRAGGTNVETTYDLAGSPLETDGPTLTLWREQPLSSSIYEECRPIQEKADREWVLALLAEAEFEPIEEPGMWSMVLYVEDGGEKTEYLIDVDGVLYRRQPDGTLWAARQAVDYFGLSALAYKYARDADEVGGSYSEWLTEAALWNYEEAPEEYADWWDSSFPKPPAAHYRLCLQSEDFHVDLDREQALVLLRALFGASWTDGAAMPSGFAAADLNWTPGESGVRLTEYLIPLGTPYEKDLRENESVIQQTFYLYSDGTLARVPQGSSGYHHIEYGIESLTPSWQRVALLENAFDPAVLDACLASLDLVQPE